MIGVDFDNTIVCYEGVFHRIAVEEGLIPPEVGAGKTAVRDWLRAAGREDAWTELQGRVYGARLDAAPPYPGVVAFFGACAAAGITAAIISHKTRHPFLGFPHDLHAAAWDWLRRNGLVGADGRTPAGGEVHFEPTKEAKLARIGACACRVFIDDLPEFLNEPAFPSGVGKALFDPHGLHGEVAGCRRFASWEALADAVLDPRAWT